MNIATLLHNAARSFGDRPAISMGSQLLFDYSELAGRTARLAGGLRNLPGVHPGDRIALAMSNHPGYLETLFAIWHAGLVAVPLNAKLHPREMAYAVGDCDARVCFTSAELHDGVVEAIAGLPGMAHIFCVDAAGHDRLLQDPLPCADADRDDLAWIFYTSGTTGRPKGAMLTHANLQLMAWSYLCDFDQLTEHDCLLHLGPQSHAGGLLALPHIAKASHHVLPASGGFDADEVASLIDQYENISFFAAPTMLRRLLDSTRLREARLGNVRTILGGAAPFYAGDVKRALALFGPRFANGYGQGECPCTITAMPKHLYTHGLDDERLVSVGLPRSGVEVRIVDEQERELEPGQVGEIVVRSDIVMRGYWNNPEATARTLANGWLHTGDLGTMDAQGYLWLKDRSKDLIISGGSNIYPREVEDVLLMDPAVADVAVVGKPDEEWGESVVAFLVTRPGHAVSTQALDQLCLDHLARFKRPKQYVFVPALPRNSTGKVTKTDLRVQLERDSGGGK
jgi:long-chain acyl-CoA synthetase